MTLETLIFVASSVISTTYGYGEVNCGDIGEPEACQIGAITASGLPFDPSIPFVAIAAPTSFQLKPHSVYLKTKTGKCHRLDILDKMNPRYIGERGFDLSPAAVELLTGKPAHAGWSERLFLCSPGQKSMLKSK